MQKTVELLLYIAIYGGLLWICCKLLSTYRKGLDDHE